MAWLKDPLVAFLLAGAAIFGVAGFFDAEDIPYTIEVREGDITRLAEQWQLQMRRPPTEQELSGLLEQYLKEEIYYREARRRGLDYNDTIVRRRMVQKLTFLTEDIATSTPRTEADLATFFEQHQDDYRIPERYSFRHRYFSSDRRPAARTDAAAALTDEALAGDPFMLQREYARRSEREIGDLFGREFAATVAELSPGDLWQGPVQSAYGWHAVQMLAVEPARVPPFGEVADRVRVDAEQAVRDAANEAYYAELKAQYTINLPVVEPAGNASPQQ